MILRNYQEECVQLMQRYEGNAGLIVMATGLGKTATFTEFLRRDVTESDHQCLILSHREELVTQPLHYLDGIPCGIELAQQHAKQEPVISASVQSLIGRLDAYNPRQIDTIIIDEAHHAVAPTYRQIIDYFQGARVFGFTATSCRSDGIGLGAVFDDILFERNTLWGINHGYLCPIEGIQARLKYKLGSVKIVDGDYTDAEIAKVMSGTAAGVAEIYKKHAKGQTIIFAASVEEAKDITKAINKQGGNIARTILAATKNRDDLLRLYRLGFIKVLVNFAVLSEGVDLPTTETIIIARPVARSNPGGYAQMVGRGLRVHESKQCCRVVDCVGISDTPICTAATLIGKDLPTPAKQPVNKLPPPPIEDKKLKVLTNEEIPKTWIKKEKEIDIMAKEIGVDAHGVNWFALPDGGEILTIPGVTYRIEPPDDGNNVLLHKNKHTAKAPMPVQFIYDFVYQDLKKNHGTAKHLWCKEKNRYWDNERLTDKQLQLINKLAPDYKVDANHMTRGDASALIKTLLYGKPVQKAVG
ncbi:MAG: DEAD/DEAH box helicase [Ruthenibacterium sp.]